MSLTYLQRQIILSGPDDRFEEKDVLELCRLGLMQYSFADGSDHVYTATEKGLDEVNKYKTLQAQLET